MVRDGQDLLDFLDAGERVDLLLVDVQMPRLDGKSVIKFLKENSLPIIKCNVISVHDDPAVMEECKCLGADGFIRKDSSLSILKGGIFTVMVY